MLYKWQTLSKDRFYDYTDIATLENRDVIKKHYDLLETILTDTSVNKKDI